MMINVQNMKTALAVAPVSLSNATATAIEVDARGYGKARFVFAVGAAAASSNISVAKIQSATSSGGSFTDITGAAFASGDIDADSDNTVHAIEVDLTDKSIGPFLQVVLTESATAAILIGVICILDQADNTPSSAADRGLATEAFA